MLTGRGRDNGLKVGPGSIRQPGVCQLKKGGIRMRRAVQTWRRQPWEQSVDRYPLAGSTRQGVWKPMLKA